MKIRTIALMILTSSSSAALCESIPPVPLRHDRAQVEVTFEEISKLPARAQSAHMVTLPPAMQEDLWALHLERYLNAHAELSDEQRELVFEGLGLLTSGIIERLDAQAAGAIARSALDSVDQQREADTTNADAPRRQLLMFDARVRLVVPKDLARKLFLQIGEKISESPRVKPLSYGECQCSTASDWCSSPTGPEWKCYMPRPRCTFCHGCGLLFLFDCNGLCE